MKLFDLYVDYVRQHKVEDGDRNTTYFMYK